MCANFSFHFHYSCITIFMLCVFTEAYTTSQQNNSNKKEKGRYILFCFFNFIICYYFITLFDLRLLFVNNGWMQIFLTITNNMIRNNNKERVNLIWFPCYIVSTFSLNFFYLIADHLLLQHSITILFFDLSKNHYNLFLLGEFIQRLTYSSQTSNLSRNNVLAILLRCIRFFHHLTSE